MPFGVNLPFVDIKKSRGTGLPFVDFDSNNRPAQVGSAPRPRQSDTGIATQPGPTAPPSNPFTQAPGGAGAAAADDNSLELAQIADQESMLRSMLERSQGRLNDGLRGIDEDFGVLTGKARNQNQRAQQDFNIKEQDTTMAKQNALGKVDTDARTLANSLRQRIGRASGSGSSAYQVTAPGAVAREASLDRDNVQDTFGTNFRDLGVARQRTEEDFGTLLQDYGRQKDEKTRGLREGFLDQENQLSGELGNLSRNRTALQGGGIGAIRAASAPYQADISRRQQAIDGLFNSRTPYQSRDLNVQAPSLRDYVTDGSQVTQGQQQAGQTSTSPYARFLQPQEEDERLL